MADYRGRGRERGRMVEELAEDKSVKKKKSIFRSLSRSRKSRPPSPDVVTSSETPPDMPNTRIVSTSSIGPEPESGQLKGWNPQSAQALRDIDNNVPRSQEQERDDVRDSSSTTNSQKAQNFSRHPRNRSGTNESYEEPRPVYRDTILPPPPKPPTILEQSPTETRELRHQQSYGIFHTPPEQRKNSWVEDSQSLHVPRPSTAAADSRRGRDVPNFSSPRMTKPQHNAYNGYNGYHGHNDHEKYQRSGPRDPPYRQPRQEQPRVERPHQDRHRQERPRQGRPFQERPPQERPPQGRPPQGRPPQGRPLQGRPFQERPRQERPRQEQPRHERPRHEQPRQESLRQEELRISGTSQYSSESTRHSSTFTKTSYVSDSNTDTNDHDEGLTVDDAIDLYAYGFGDDQKTPTEGTRNSSRKARTSFGFAEPKNSSQRTSNNSHKTDSTVNTKLPSNNTESIIKTSSGLAEPKVSSQLISDNSQKANVTADSKPSSYNAESKPVLGPGSMESKPSSQRTSDSSNETNSTVSSKPPSVNAESKTAMTHSPGDLEKTNVTNSTVNNRTSSGDILTPLLKIGDSPDHKLFAERTTSLAKPPSSFAINNTPSEGFGSNRQTSFFNSNNATSGNLSPTARQPPFVNQKPAATTNNRQTMFFSHINVEHRSSAVPEARNGRFEASLAIPRGRRDNHPTSAAIFGGEIFKNLYPGAPELVKPSSTHDQYGFRKYSRDVTIRQYEDWYRDYSIIQSRRGEKWMEMMREAGLTTRDPEVFPARSVKMQRFIRKGIPPMWRGAVWFFYAGGPEVLQKNPDKYGDLVVEAQQGKLSEGDKESIERDLHRTFPDNIHFKPDKVEMGHNKLEETELLSSLRRVLSAFAIHHPKIGYCQSLNFLAGLLLLFLTEEKAFWMLHIIATRLLPGTHETSLEGANVDLWVLMLALKDAVPGVWAKVGNEPDKTLSRLPPISLCTTSWFMSIFIGTLPTESALRVWDALFYDGSVTIFRVAVAIFRLGESEIKAVGEQMESFQVVQSLPRKMLDIGELMNTAYRKNPVSSAWVEKKRKERKDWYAEERLAERTRKQSKDGERPKTNAATLDPLGGNDDDKASKPELSRTKSTGFWAKRSQSLRRSKTSAGAKRSNTVKIRGL